jgi:DNA-binding NarL/FixJ family response regulator
MTVTNAFFRIDDMTIGSNTEPPKAVLVRPLSPRESQILGLLEQGRTPKEVAFELGISAATVRVLISRAAKKGSRARRP